MTLTSGQKELQRRSQANAIVIEDKSLCYACGQTNLDESIEDCPNCEFPQGGDQRQMQWFVNNSHRKKKLIVKQKKALGYARIALYIWGAIAVILGIIAIVGSEVSLGILAIISGLVYAGLGFWTTKEPYKALVVASSLLVVLTIIDTIIDWKSIFDGLFGKAVVFYLFYYALNGLKKSDQYEKDLAKLKSKVLKQPF